MGRPLKYPVKDINVDETKLNIKYIELINNEINEETKKIGRPAKYFTEEERKVAHSISQKKYNQKRVVPSKKGKYKDDENYREYQREYQKEYQRKYYYKKKQDKLIKELENSNNIDIKLNYIKYLLDKDILIKS